MGGAGRWGVVGFTLNASVFYHRTQMFPPRWESAQKTACIAMFIMSLISSSHFTLNLIYMQEMGIMDWEKLAQRDPNTSRTSFYLIVHLGALCADADCHLGTIMDGQQSAVIDYATSEPEWGAYIVDIITEPIRSIIASFIHHVSCHSNLCNLDDASLVPCQGTIY